MSLISDLMQMVASLTTRLNEIGANSKRTEEMPLMNPIDRSSLIRLSKNGLSYKTPFQALIDELGVEDGVIQIGDLEIVSDGAGGQNLKIPAMPNPIWRLQGTEYTKITETLIPIPYAATEKYRTDIIVGNSSNGFDRIPGIEGDFIGIPPNIPTNTVEITRLNIFGNQIGAPSLPSMNGFITKTSKQYRSYQFQQPTPQLLFLSHEYTTHLIRREDSPNNTRVCLGFTIDPGGFPNMIQLPYDGMDIYVKSRNNSDEPIILKHNHSTGIPFWFKDGEDLEVNRDDIVHLKFNKVGNRVEFVGISSGAVDAINVSYINAGFNNVEEALDSLFYLAPLITSFTNNQNTVEKGSVITSVTLNWALNKTMTALSINQGIGSVLGQTSEVHSGQNITTNRTYTMTASDGANTTTRNTSIIFQNMRYWGTSEQSDLAILDISTLQNSQLSASRSQTRTINGGGDFMVFAYPSSFGAASFIVNGLPNTAFTTLIKPFTNSKGFTEDYRIYRTDFVQNGTLTIQVI